MTASNKILIVTKSDINIFCDIECEVPARIKVIDATGIFKCFKTSCSGYSFPVGDPLLDYKGNRNEEKLKQKSDANKGKKPGGGD